MFFCKNELFEFFSFSSGWIPHSQVRVDLLFYCENSDLCTLIVMMNFFGHSQIVVFIEAIQQCSE